jgi:glycosyltransferase involved in cell wall biosynthesis
MRRLKIALLANSYWEENLRHHDHEEGGGTQQLAEAVAALGHEIVVLSQSVKVGKLRQDKIGVLETWLAPGHKPRDFFTGLRDRWAKKTYSHRRIYSDAKILRDFLKLRGPFDVLWAATEAPDGLSVAMAARLGVKLPPLLVQIEALRQRFEKRMPVFTERLALGLAFRQATRLLAPSELIVNSLARYARPGLKVEDIQAKVHVVYPNIQRAFLRTPDEAPLPGPLPDRVLFLGELDRAKGGLVFLSSLPKTEMSRRNSTFVITGDFIDPTPAFIKRWDAARESARMQLVGARMEFLGRVSTYEVIRQIKLAQVIVIPAIFSAFSRGLVESLILGRPVITTESVGSASLVQAHACGFVIPPYDSSALARAIDLMISDPAPYTTNAEHLAHRLIHEFSPEAIALQVAHHLSEIAAPEK